MGLLDRLRSAARRLTSPGTDPAAAPTARPKGTVPFLAASRPPAGPLRLALGDHVTHYRDRFSVVGIRALDGEGTSVLHYCLRDSQGAAAVIACEGGATPTLWLQRTIAVDVRWDADQIDGVTDEPLRLARAQRLRVRTWGTTGAAANIRSAACRAYADPSGDRVLTLEDYDGRREARLGDPVFEAEMEFERASGESSLRTPNAALAGASAFEETEAIVAGSPRAAAEALETSALPGRRVVRAAGEGPAAYDDDEWSDAGEVELPAAPPPRSSPVRRSLAVEDEDEWISATQLVRERGENGLDEDDYDAKRLAK